MSKKIQVNKINYLPTRSFKITSHPTVDFLDHSLWSHGFLLALHGEILETIIVL